MPTKSQTATDPEQDALLAESVGIALLVILDRLTPAERVSFVLHDIFDLSFEEIGGILQRSPAAVRQLASRGRKRVRGNTESKQKALAKQQRVADRFLKALRSGNLSELLTVLDPDLQVAIDASAAIPGQPRLMQGASTWAEQAIAISSGARFTQLAKIDGGVGVIVAPRGKLLRALRLQFVGEKIARIDVVSDPENLDQLTLSLL